MSLQGSSCPLLSKPLSFCQFDEIESSGRKKGPRRAQWRAETFRRMRIKNTSSNTRVPCGCTHHLEHHPDWTSLDQSMQTDGVEPYSHLIILIKLSIWRPSFCLLACVLCLGLKAPHTCGCGGTTVPSDPSFPRIPVEPLQCALLLLYLFTYYGTS